MAVSVLIAAASIYAALVIYRKRSDIAETVAGKFKKAYRILLNKYYVDEIYDAAVVNPIVKISTEILWKGVDSTVIDGTINGSASLTGRLAQAVRRIQNGVAQSYALVFVVGILFVLTWVLFK
jgi:NADH-quinone oxidoreductase subunit L